MWARLLWYAIVNFRRGKAKIARQLVDEAWKAHQALAMTVDATCNGKALKDGGGKGLLGCERLIRRLRCFWRDLTGGWHLPVADENTLDDNFVFEVRHIEGINSEGKKVKHESWEELSTHWIYHWWIYNERGDLEDQYLNRYEPRLIYRFQTTGIKSVRLKVEGRTDLTRGMCWSDQFDNAFEVWPSRVEARLGKFLRSRLVASGAALVLAALAGLVVYGLQPTFGSLKDYLLAFLWGSTADQAANQFGKLPGFLKGLLRRQ